MSERRDRSPGRGRRDEWHSRDSRDRDHRDSRDRDGNRFERRRGTDEAREREYTELSAYLSGRSSEVLKQRGLKTDRLQTLLETKRYETNEDNLAQLRTTIGECQNEQDALRDESRMLEKLTQMLNFTDVRSNLDDLERQTHDLSTQLRRTASKHDYNTQQLERRRRDDDRPPTPHTARKGGKSGKGGKGTKGRARRVMCVPREPTDDETMTTPPQTSQYSSGSDVRDQILDNHKAVYQALRDYQVHNNQAKLQDLMTGFNHKTDVLLRRFDKRVQADLVVLLKLCETGAMTVHNNKTAHVLRELQEEYPAPCVEHTWIDATMRFMEKRREAAVKCYNCGRFGHRSQQCPDSRDSLLREKQERQKLQLAQHNLI